MSRQIGMSRFARMVAVVCTCAVFSLLASATASANQTINAFSVTTTTTQAGGHPDVEMSFELKSPGAPESARDVTVNTPEGVFGSPNAIDKCISQDFALEQCPSSSQAGLITVYANHGGNPNKLLGTAPIYNREAIGDETALFSFIVPTLDIPVSIPVSVRTTGDYGLRFTVSQLTQLAPLRKAKLTYWGFPADPSNDDERFPKGSLEDPAGCPGVADASCIGAPVPAGVSSKPMINNPSICTAEPLKVSIEVVTYQDPDTPSTAVSDYPASTGCYAMIFRPLLLATPTTKEADSPAGLDLTMSAPQPAGKATTPSPIRSAVLTLPKGLTINPDAADGQSACADEDANFRSEGPANCPDNAKIGTFEVGSPSLDGPLEGAIYIGEPKPGDQYRLFLIARGFGINAKFVGNFRPDPVTGQVTAFIEGLPQVSFDRFELHLFASDRGLMATPTHCTLYEVQARFFPWNSALPDQTSTQLFSIDSGPDGTPCPGQKRPFKPRLIAGTTNSQGGGFSDFALQLDRDDGDQFLGDLGFTMPPGFTGSLVGISYCSDAAIAQAVANPGRTELANPSCPPGSQIGSTNVAAGPGGHPFNVQGKIYFAGPLKGAPLSLVAITPALAGPYDYGTQVVKVALHVDPLDAHVRAVSDTVPSIIGGVPIRLRTIRVNLNRPNFIINPTDCTETTIHSEGIGDQGTVVGFDSFFHPVNCFSLGFKPKMTVRRIGRKASSRAKNPELQFDLRTRPGDANIKSISVTLSHAFEIDQNHIGNICSEKELTANQCAGRTPIGEATTSTPLLDRPLSGPVYAVSGSGGLPRLAFILNGQVNLIPRGDTKTTRRGQLQTTVPVVPDAPVGHFSLKVFGGKTGYLINTRNICAHTPVTQIAYTAHNGKTHSEKVKLQAACGGGVQARHKRHR